MPKYSISATFQINGFIEVEAENEAELIQVAEEIRNSDFKYNFEMDDFFFQEAESEMVVYLNDVEKVEEIKSDADLIVDVTRIHCMLLALPKDKQDEELMREMVEDLNTLSGKKLQKHHEWAKDCYLQATGKPWKFSFTDKVKLEGHLF
jgi:hypothetical protein